MKRGEVGWCTIRGLLASYREGTGTQVATDVHRNKTDFLMAQSQLQP